MNDELTTPKIPTVSGSLAPPVYTDPPTTTAAPAAMVTTIPPTPQAGTTVPAKTWTVDTSSDPVETTKAPELDPVVESSKTMEESEFTREPLEEPWFPKLYVIIDSNHYIQTGELRVLSALGNTLSTETYRQRDFGQLWFTNFKGFIKNASTNTMLTSEGDCQNPGLTDGMATTIRWNFKKTKREREYDIVAQCGSKLHAAANNGVTLDPIGSPWHVLPVARVNF